MKQATYATEHEVSHWFELKQTGELTHAIHRFGIPVTEYSWKLHEGIIQYQLVTASGIQHAVVLMKSGLYYVRAMDDRQVQQTVRIESYAGVSSLYISLQGESIYIGYMLQDHDKTSFVLRTYEHGIWRASLHPIPHENEQSPARLQQVVYTRSGDDILLGLLRIDDEQVNSSAVWSMRLNISNKEIKWQHVYETKLNSSVWQMIICSDPAGQSHASWTYKQDEAVHHFYRSLHSEPSYRFRYISFDENPPCPHFMWQQELLSLLFIYNDQKVLYTCSDDGGEHWSAYQEMHFHIGFPLLLVQGVQIDHNIISPYPLLGFAAPIFRPLTWLDIVNPFYSFKTLLPFNQIANYITYQLNQMQIYMNQELMVFQRDMNRLVLRKQQLEQQVAKSAEEQERLTDVEKMLLQELNADRDHESLEHFSHRRIQ